MSTRGLTGIRFKDANGKEQFKGCYNHADSYPGGLGKDVVSFVEHYLRYSSSLETMKENIKKVTWIQDEESLPTPQQILELYEMGYPLESEVLNTYRNAGANAENEFTWYWVLRDIQGEPTLEWILRGIPYLIDATSFIEDSIFCEYAYVLDLEGEKIEFYESGCNLVGKKSFDDVGGWESMYSE